MKIIFIHTYPIYHSKKTEEEWVKLENRDKWMPALLSSMGHEVEYWIGGLQSGTYTYTDPESTLPSYTIRSFETVKTNKRPKFHFSKQMIEFAKASSADHFILKGVDGGIGVYLIEKYLKKNRIPYSFVIGGDYYSKHVPDANFVFFETEYQSQTLLHPGWRFWRKRCSPDQLYFLPKSINTDVFKPDSNIEKQWDIISVGRLVPNYKNYDELGDLSNTFSVCLVGDGPLRSSLEKKYPNLHFHGSIPNHKIPEFIQKSRVFFHSGKRDYNPRVITESMACGVPPVAFGNIIKQDVVPYGCGYLIPEEQIYHSFSKILSNEAEIELFGKNARALILQERSRNSSLEVLRKTFGAC